MNRWTKSAAMLVLSAALAPAQAQQGERGRGADYGDYSDRSRGQNDKRAPERYRDRNEGSRSQQDYSRRERQDENGRQDEALNRRIAGWEGGYRADERGNRSSAQRGQHAERNDYPRQEYRPGRNDPRARHYNDHERYVRHDNRRDYRHDRGYDHHDWRAPSWRPSWNHGWNGHRYRAPVRYVYPRGFSRGSWRVGYHVPSVFLRADYYVDYRDYRLAPPPYGCRWVRVDGDLLLIELISGEVVDALYEFFYF